MHQTQFKTTTDIYRLEQQPRTEEGKQKQDRLQGLYKTQLTARITFDRQSRYRTIKETGLKKRASLSHLISYAKFGNPSCPHRHFPLIHAYPSWHDRIGLRYMSDQRISCTTRTSSDPRGAMERAGAV